MTTYLLDANVFIQAKNQYYSFEICPGFWDWLDASTGPSLASIVSVRDELLKGTDSLADWIKQRKKATWFLDVADPPTQKAFQEIAGAVTNSARYSQAAVNHFLSGADPWLVAKAKVIGATVVTLEVQDVASKKKVPLPNVCAASKVPFINTFALLHTMNASFVLRKAKK